MGLENTMSREVKHPTTFPAATGERGRKTNRIRWYGTALFLCYWLALTVGTHLPRVPQVIVFSHGWDKLWHFLAFAGLAYLACIAWTMQPHSALKLPQFGIVLLAFSLYGALDEITQIPVGRTCELADWWADVFGTLTGVLLFIATSAVGRRIVRPPQDKQPRHAARRGRESVSTTPLS